jgi:hypothetical protein
LLAIPVAFVGVLTFFNPSKDRPAGNPVHFLLMIVLSSLFLWLAARAKARPALSDSAKLRASVFFLGGLAFLAAVLVSILLAGVKAPLPVFYGYNVLLVAVALSFLCRQTLLPINNVLLFAIGDDTLLALFGLVAAIGAGSVQRATTNVGFILLFAWLFIFIRNRRPVSGFLTD